MRTNRPAAHRATRPTTQVAAVATVLALVVTSVVIALAAFAAGAYPRRDAEEAAPAQTSATRTAQAGEGRGAGPTASTDLIDPSVGRGAGSRVCSASPRSPRCRIEGGSGLSRTRGGHALRPATDGPETLLDSEWDETGPADMPGRAPGRGGWVGEEGPSRA